MPKAFFLPSILILGYIDIFQTPPKTQLFVPPTVSPNTLKQKKEVKTPPTILYSNK